jgi:hypothetical protein
MILNTDRRESRAEATHNQYGSLVTHGDYEKLVGNATNVQNIHLI